MSFQTVNGVLVERDPELSIEFEFVHATENAALNTVHWVGRGDKERADAAACSAIRGTFDLIEISGEVVIGEGIKDNAPGISAANAWEHGRQIRPSLILHWTRWTVPATLRVVWPIPCR